LRQHGFLVIFVVSLTSNALKPFKRNVNDIFTGFDHLRSTQIATHTHARGQIGQLYFLYLKQIIQASRFHPFLFHLVRQNPSIFFNLLF